MSLDDVFNSTDSGRPLQSPYGSWIGLMQILRRTFYNSITTAGWSEQINSIGYPVLYVLNDRITVVIWFVGNDL